MTSKYEITDVQRDIQHPKNKNYFRIRALRDIPSAKVKAGDLGGWIENENNLSQEGECWVTKHAYVGENACVSGNARVYGYATVCGKAQVYDNAQVYGCATVTGTTKCNEDMKIHRCCMIERSDQIYYVDGITAYFDSFNRLITNGTAHNIKHHRTLARLKLL